AYANAVSANVSELISSGFLLEADGAELIREAQQANVP
ncbi:MAG: hypothetical protein ACJA2Q_002820, partial [Pseudohongiellaceae bacterium]